MKKLLSNMSDEHEQGESEDRTPNLAKKSEADWGNGVSQKTEEDHVPLDTTAFFQPAKKELP